MNLRELFLENLNLKLVSVAAALLLYSLVHGGRDVRRSIVVDLEARLPSESSNRVLKATTDLPAGVRIFLRGSSTTIDDLRASSVNLQVDVSNGNVSHLAFEPGMVRFPAGVRVDIEQFEPPGLDLEWEERIVRDVQVQTSAVGSPSPGFVVKGPPVPEPRTVRIRGPESDVAVLQHVRAEGFDVTGLSEGAYPRPLGLERLPARLRVEPPSVIATIDIAREVAERSFPKLAVVVTGQSKAKTVPAEVDVRLVCPPDVARALRPEQVVPRVDVASREASGSLSVSVAVELERCEAKVTPQSVIVRW